MYLYTLELPKREVPKGHPTFVEGGRTYMVQVLSHTRAAAVVLSIRAECECACVGLGLGLLILKFFEQFFFKTFALQSIGLGGGLSLNRIRPN